MYNVIIILFLLGFYGCNRSLYSNEHKDIGCLVNIAVKPYGLDVNEYLLPKEITEVFGNPLSIDTVPITAGPYSGKKVIYKYEDQTFYFMQKDSIIALYSLEIFKGQVGCLKIGDSKDSYIKRFGTISGNDEDVKYFYADSIEYILSVKFNNNKISYIRPNFGDVFK
jgi:hypothetical protein